MNDTLCRFCGKPEDDDFHNAAIQVAATECPESTVADQMQFHQFKSRATVATLRAPLESPEVADYTNEQIANVLDAYAGADNTNHLGTCGRSAMREASRRLREYSYAE